MAVSAVVATVGSAVVGGVAQSSAASKAAKAQQRSVDAANATEQKFYNETKDELQPFINTGVSAGNKISDLEGLGGAGSAGIMSTLEGLPGYQFANQQGLKSVQNSATARGLGVSGASQKGAANYSTGLANQYYNNLLTGIQATQNTGEAAASSLGGAATSFGESIGANTIGAGNARAAGDIARGNAISTAGNGIGNGLIASSLLQGIGSNPGQTNQYGGVGQAATMSPSTFSGSNSFGQIGGGNNGFYNGSDWFAL